MPNTLNELLIEAVAAARAGDMRRMGQLQQLVDQWLIDTETRDAHTAVLTALTEVLEVI